MATYRAYAEEDKYPLIVQMKEKKTTSTSSIKNTITTDI
jgi:hypothetical protein